MSSASFVSAIELTTGLRRNQDVLANLGRNICQVASLKASMKHSPINGNKQPIPSPISRRQLLKDKVLPLILASLIPMSPSLAATSTDTAADGSLSAEDTEKALKALREVTGLQDLAFEYTNRYDFPQAEILWTKIIALNDKNAAAYSNRGNCRTSQGKFEEAVSDFNEAITLAPEEPDPYLGRGVALEGIKEYRQALQAYETANEKSINKYKTADAVAINNTGNAYGALGEWENAFTFYKKAADMDSRFVFALANESLALFQLGTDDKTAEKKIMGLIRKYPSFADMHAANAMIKWERNEKSKAEDEWYKAVESDARYENLSWVREVRRWPPRLISILETFRTLK